MAAKEDDSIMRKYMRETDEGKEMDFVGRVTYMNKERLTWQVRDGVLIKRRQKSSLTPDIIISAPLFQNKK